MLFYNNTILFTCYLFFQSSTVENKIYLHYDASVLVNYSISNVVVNNDLSYDTNDRQYD